MGTEHERCQTVLCCLADAELSAWAARCFVAAGLNAAACRSFRQLSGYLDTVQAQAVVVDHLVFPKGTRDVQLRAWATDELVTCAVVERSMDAADLPADVIFRKPLSCMGMAQQLLTMLRRETVPSDLRAAGPVGPVHGVGLGRRWCQLEVDLGVEPKRSLDLTLQHYRMLHALMSTPGRVWSRDALIAVMQTGGGSVQSLRTIDQIVRRVRERLNTVGLAEALVTSRGEGYAWDAQVVPFGSR